MRSRIGLVLLASLVGTLFALSAAAGIWDKVKESVGGAKDVLSPTDTQGALGDDEIAQGLREALEVGAEKAVGRASAVGGFLNNPQIRIPLPGKLESAGSLLRTLGMGSQVTAFEETLNRAAEKAATKALPIFGDAVSQLTFEDVRRIWSGGDTAATTYLKDKTEERLYDEFRPVVHEAAQQVGVTRAYQSLTSSPQVQSLVAGGELDLDHYVTDKALDGVFTLLAEEEKQIRTNPVARTTDLLKKVFGE